MDPKLAMRVEEEAELDDGSALPPAAERPSPAPRPAVDPIAGLDSAAYGEHRGPTPGPLVAVCGLCGGAGASTLAYLTARSAAGSTNESVLVCDTGGPTGGLAAYAGVEAPRSLARLANAVAAHEPLGQAAFANAQDGMRVLASKPHLDIPADEAGLARVLRDAREAHRLTVVDCGTLQGETDRQVLEAASHVVWVLPATVGATRRGWHVLQLFGVEDSRLEAVVARHDAAGRKPPMEQLSSLAATRNAPLVLMPHVPDLGERSPEEALEAAELSLDAIRIAIRR